MAEVEVRQEVTQEYEERIRDMEATFAQRRKNDVSICAHQQFTGEKH